MKSYELYTKYPLQLKLFLTTHLFNQFVVNIINPNASHIALIGYAKFSQPASSFTTLNSTSEVVKMINFLQLRNEQVSNLGRYEAILVHVRTSQQHSHFRALVSAQQISDARPPPVRRFALIFTGTKCVIGAEESINLTSFFPVPPTTRRCPRRN